MTKFISFVLCLCFVFPVFAGTKSEIKSVVDDLNYTLSVEWDQQDEAFLKSALNVFEAKLSEKGISHKDLLSYAAEENNMSVQELMKLIREGATYKKGSSWNGVIYVLGGIGLGIGIFFTVVLLDSMDITG